MNRMIAKLEKKRSITSVRKSAYLVCLLAATLYFGINVTGTLLILPVLMVLAYVAGVSWLGFFISTILTTLLVGSKPQPSWIVFFQLFTFYILAFTAITWVAFKSVRMKMLTLYAGITTFLTYMAAGIGGGLGALFVFGPRALRKRTISHTELQAHFVELGLNSPIVLGGLVGATVFFFAWVLGSRYILRVRSVDHTVSKG